MAVILHHAEYGHIAAELLRHLPDGVRVGHAAVDQEQIRQGQELFVPVRRPLQSPAQHLPHGGVVVGVAAGQFLDLEPAVGGFQGFCPLIDHHGGHNVAAAGVGDIEGLHPLRRMGQIQHFLQNLQGVGRFFLGGGGPLDLLLGVADSHVRQGGFLPPLGHVDPDPVARPLGQGLRQPLAVPGVHAQQNFVGQNGPGQIVLGGDGRQQFRRRLLHGCRQQFRLPAHQVAVFHVEHGVAALPRSPEHAPHIRVGAQSGDHRLLLAQGADGLDAVPQLGRLLKPQGLRLRLHFCGHVPDQLLGTALQQLAGLLDPAVIFRLRHLRTAEAVAPAHVEVQAGPLRADIPGELAAAGGQPQGLAHRVHRLPGLIPPAEGAEVFGAVVGGAVHQGEPGIPPPAEPDEGIPLVILQQDVVMGHVALDEGVFQHQGLELAGDENGVEMIHLAHHLPGLQRVGGAFLEVLAHPVFQLLRLAHIDDLPGLVHHQIDPRQQRQVVGLGPQLVLRHGSAPFLSVFPV